MIGSARNHTAINQMGSTDGRSQMSESTKSENDIELTREGIADFILKLAQRTWEDKRSPLLLSNISPELKLRGVNYKDVLSEGETLRQFVSTLYKSIRIVAHPFQKAKIGVVPNESNFAFEVEPTVEPKRQGGERPKKTRLPSQRYIVMQFLTALSRLTEEEQKSVNIPVHILARLMEDK
jgi:hypothetical protein